LGLYEFDRLSVIPATERGFPAKLSLQIPSMYILMIGMGKSAVSTINFERWHTYESGFYREPHVLDTQKDNRRERTDKGRGHA